jgi:hypothetical protein
MGRCRTATSFVPELLTELMGPPIDLMVLDSPSACAGSGARFVDESSRSSSGRGSRVCWAEALTEFSDFVLTGSECDWIERALLMRPIECSIRGITRACNPIPQAIPIENTIAPSRIRRAIRRPWLALLYGAASKIRTLGVNVGTIPGRSVWRSMAASLWRIPDSGISEFAGVTVSLSTESQPTSMLDVRGRILQVGSVFGLLGAGFGVVIARIDVFSSVSKGLGVEERRDVGCINVIIGRNLVVIRSGPRGLVDAV